MEDRQLETERLRLRRWRNDDHNSFAAICADPDVMRFIGDGSTRTAEEASCAIAHFEKEWDERGFGMFAVELRRTEEFIGFTGLSRPDFMPELLPSVEIGWRLGKAHWSKGYATEAACTALAFGASVLANEKVVSICQVGNNASTRIMEKIGLKFDRRSIDPTCGREVEVYQLQK